MCVFTGVGSTPGDEADPLRDEEERALVERARRDPAAFRELYAAYLPRVYAYVAARLEHRAEVEDLVATAMLRVVEHLDAFEPRGAGSFAAWLFRITHNLLSDAHRERGRAPALVPLDAAADLPDAGPSPDGAALQGEERARLRRLVGALPPRRQEVVALRFFAGLRNREIAAVLGLDERTVAAHLCRGLEELHRRYAADRVEKETGAR